VEAAHKKAMAVLQAELKDLKKKNTNLENYLERSSLEEFKERATAKLKSDLQKAETRHAQEISKLKDENASQQQIRQLQSKVQQLRGELSALRSEIDREAWFGKGSLE
jgi:predicted RNase H-like nuclease (RuvC/YqgF family)